MKSVNWADGASKLVGELWTTPLSVIATTRICAQTTGSVLGVGDTKQKFCLPEDILSGTQAVCPPLPFRAPNIDSESIADVRIDRTEEGSRMVSGAGGSPVAGDLAFAGWMMTGSSRVGSRRAPNSTLVAQSSRNSLAPKVSRILSTRMVLATIAEKKVPMVRKRRGTCGTTASFPRFTILLRALVLTLGEARGLACADGYTAAGDTETTITCLYDPELPSRLLKGFHSFMQVGAARLSPSVPPSTLSHDCPDGTTDCSSGERFQGPRLPLC